MHDVCAVVDLAYDFLADVRRTTTKCYAGGKVRLKAVTLNKTWPPKTFIGDDCAQARSLSV